MAECIPITAARSEKWDILKFFLIFLVVLGHAADYYTSDSETMKSLFIFIYSFHMPVFIFVSGLFAKRNVNENRMDKIAGYLIIYVVLKLYPFCYRNLAGQSAGFHLFTENGVPWFMLALFWFNLITMILKKASFKLVLPLSIAIACVIGYTTSVGDFLALSRTIVYYPFFYIGYISDRKNIENFCNKKAVKTSAALFLLLFGVLIFSLGDKIYWLRPLLTGRNPFITLGDFSEWGFLFRLLYYVVILAVGFAVIAIVPDKTPYGLISKLGQRTLAVYGLHYIVFYFMFEKFDCKSVFERLLGQNSEWIIYPLSLMVTLFFSLKFFNDFLVFLMGFPMRLKKRK